MGCWNETCLFSKLSIREGELAYMVIRNPYYIILPVMLGEYDEYGGLKNIQSEKEIEDFYNLHIRHLVSSATNPSVSFKDILESNEIKDKLHMNVAGYQMPISKFFVRKDVMDELLNLQQYKELCKQFTVKMASEGIKNNPDLLDLKFILSGGMYLSAFGDLQNYMFSLYDNEESLKEDITLQMTYVYHFMKDCRFVDISPGSQFGNCKLSLNIVVDVYKIFLNIAQKMRDTMAS